MFSLHLSYIIFPVQYSGTKPRNQWEMWHPTLVAEAVFAIANIFSSLRLISLFTANSHLGPLQISLGRMLLDILKFLFIYCLVNTRRHSEVGLYTWQDLAINILLSSRFCWPLLMGWTNCTFTTKQRLQMRKENARASAVSSRTTPSPRELILCELVKQMCDVVKLSVKESVCTDTIYKMCESFRNYCCC